MISIGNFVIEDIKAKYGKDIFYPEKHVLSVQQMKAENGETWW